MYHWCAIIKENDAQSPLDLCHARYSFEGLLTPLLLIIMTLLTENTCILQRVTQHSGTQTPLAELKLPLKLKWRRGKDMPFEVWGYPSVVVLKDKVYIGGGIASADNEQIVIVYDPKQDSCDTLPPYTYNYFSMAVVNDQLVLVGGSEAHNYSEKTNKLGVWNVQSREWTHPLPPMTTACDSPSVATHNNRWLVVMGGSYSGDENDLSRVEILDTTESLQWYEAASLPQPCYQVSSATIGNMCYLLDGFTDDDPTNKAFSVCLDDLISQAVSQSSASPTSSPWQSLPDAPLTQSTALAFKGALLTVGGEVYGNSAIHIYQPSSKQWVKAGELPNKRCVSGCIVLPSGEVLVAGGGVDETHQMIEIASIL